MSDAIPSPPSSSRNLLLQAILAKTPLPIFSGQAKDWPQFGKQWQRFSALLESAGQTLTTPVLIQVFLGCLDTVSQALVEVARSKDPSIPFQGLWDLLDREYGSDTSDQSRKRWQDIKLKQGEQLNRQAWMEFKHRFDLAKLEVDDRTEGEEADLVFAQLPSSLQRAVREEEVKRRRHQYWVRFAPSKVFPCSRFKPKSANSLNKEFNALKSSPAASSFFAPRKNCKIISQNSPAWNIMGKPSKYFVTKKRCQRTTSSALSRKGLPLRRTSVKSKLTFMPPKHQQIMYAFGNPKSGNPRKNTP